jgi:hypothetical protein
MHPELSSLYDRHAAAAFDKQLYLNELVRDFDWHFNQKSGLLSFGNRWHWQAQILGTEAWESGTWLWAWANPTPGLPTHLLLAARSMKELGGRLQIPELTEAQLPLGKMEGHFLAAVGSGVCRANAYFRGLHAGGAVFLLIIDRHFHRPVGHPLARVLCVFPQAISALRITNHQVALASYLHYYGLDGRTEGNTLVVEEAGRPMLTATFDELNRLQQLDGTIAA